ncbi:MAG: hypothetical protein QG602_428 [Verrucomicrobiota bacterium]|nr:hypothetical protein [Verrucomicrobiota bacterium]
MIAERPDYEKAAGVHRWLIEPRSHRLRSNRAVALVLALHGPSVWNVTSLIEVAEFEGMSEKTLRHLRRELAVCFSIRPVNFAAPIDHLKPQQAATEPDFEEMGTPDDEDFFAAREP